MATIKLHLYSNEDDGTVSCDYRGQGELKGQHKTLVEREFGPDVHDNVEIEKVLEWGPQLNRIFSQDGVPGLGIRIGVFDH